MPAAWVGAAGAVVSAGTAVYNSSQQGKATGANNANAQNIDNAQNQMLNQASTIANQPFVSYSGDLTAPMSGNQQQGYTLASNEANQGTAQQDNAQATNLAGQVANNGFSQSTIENYMNPYTQDVTNQALSAENATYLNNLGAQQEKSAQSNAFGGSGNAIENAALTGQHEQTVGNTVAQGNAAAFQSGVQDWQADNQNKLAASNAYETAGQDLTNMDASQVSQLVTTGGVAQAINQTDLSNQYNQFMRQQNWSANQLQDLFTAVGTAKGNGQITAPQASNVGNQLLGLGSTIAGLAGGSNMFSGSSTSQPQLSSSESSGLESDAVSASAPSLDSGSISGIADNGYTGP